MNVLLWGLLVGVSSAFVAPFTILRGHAVGVMNPAPSPRRLQLRAQSRSSRAAVFASLQLDSVPEFKMRDINFERYVGQVAYTESVSIEGSGPSLTEEGTLRAGAAFVATVGTATVRVFEGSLTDISIKTRGDDVRVLLKEYPPANEDDGVDLAANEAAAIAALEGDAFPRLFGRFRLDFSASEKFNGEWIDAFGTLPPRAGCTWLVYAFDGDGGNTLLSFSLPTKVRIAAAEEARGGRRALALPPLPRDVSWLSTGRFVVKGIMPQALAALASVHEAGLAHRVLSPASIQLGAKTGMNKNVALEYCDPSMLSVKFSDFGRATPLDSPDTGALGGGLALVSQDLRALGIIFLQLLLGALAETVTVDPNTNLPQPLPRPPPVTGADLVRQLALFDDRIAGDSGTFSEFCRGEDAWCKVVALLDADNGSGWEFIELLVGAPSALRDDVALSLRSARGIASHPFLKTQAIERVSRGSDLDSPKAKLFGLFDW